METTPFHLSSRGKAEFPKKLGPQGWDAFPFVTNPLEIPPHMKTLGICWIIYGIFRLGMGVVAVLLAPTATVMFGALLTRVADPFTWMDLFHVLYAGCAAFAFLCGILSIIGGFALLRNPASGRGTLLAASFLSLSDLPVGIAISVYTLIALLRISAVAPPTQSRS